MISRRIIRKLVRDREDWPLSELLSRNIIYCSVEIPKLVVDMPKRRIWQQEENEDLDRDQKVALSLARMQQVKVGLNIYFNV